MLTSMLEQLPCKLEELPSAYVHVRAVAMYVHVGAVAMYHAKTHGIAELRLPCRTTAVAMVAQLQLPCMV